MRTGFFLTNLPIEANIDVITCEISTCFCRRTRSVLFMQFSVISKIQPQRDPRHTSDIISRAGAFVKGQNDECEGGEGGEIVNND